MIIQDHAEMMRKDRTALRTYAFEKQERIANLNKQGRVLSGRVRVAGKEISGKSLERRVETATIKILGISGVAILLLLVLMPIPIIFQHKGIVSDVESSYKRAMMKIDEVESSLDVPRTAPSISAREIDNRNMITRHLQHNH